MIRPLTPNRYTLLSLFQNTESERIVTDAVSRQYSFLQNSVKTSPCEAFKNLALNVAHSFRVLRVSIEAIVIVTSMEGTFSRLSTVGKFR